jgi:uncharacterized delta-60 repeat protein
MKNRVLNLILLQVKFLNNLGLLLLLTVFFASKICGQQGTLDSSFEIGTGFNNIVYSTAIQSDGKIIVGGNFTSFDGTNRTRLVRLNADGTLDASFFNVEIFGLVTTVEIQSDDKIIFGGSMYNSNNTINKLARLNADGTLDNTFNIGTGITGNMNNISSTSIQSDGKIIILGQFTSYNGTTCNNIARLNSDGTYDTTFDSGTGFNSYTLASATQSDGKIYVGGNFTEYNGTLINRIVRLNTDGSLDTSFDPGTGCNNEVRDFVIQADGKVIFGGAFSQYNDQILKVVRLNTDGTVDNDFIVPTSISSVGAIALQSDQKIVLVCTNSATPVSNNIFRLNADGTNDPTIAFGIKFNSSVYSVSIQNDGKLIIGGNFTAYNGITTNRIARLNGDISLNVNEHFINNISIFPNPAQDVITISELPLGAELSILDITGKVMFNTIVNSNQLIINTDEFSNGIYLVNVYTNGSTSTKKLVVNK